MNPIRIQTFNEIAPSGLARFEQRGYLFGPDIKDPDGILVRSADLHGLSFGPSLRCIARAGAGVNNIPVSLCSEKGIAVFNTPGANANAVKELVICALFLSSRRILDGVQWVSSACPRSAEKLSELVEQEKSRFAGPEIYGKTLGVVGLGAIGVMVANAAVALGMDVYGYDPYISVDAAWGLSREVNRAKSLKSLYENSDYISLHVPLTDETHGMVGEVSLPQMKRGIRILNFSRGELVDTRALLAALARHDVSFYATDFPVPELIGAQNVLLFPHLGASTPESEENCACMAADEMIRFLENGTIANSVNFPNVRMDREGIYRLCVVHRNIPNMINQVTSRLAGDHVNIENMINRSKRDYAYTLVDTNTPPTAQILSHLQNVPDILSVRVIQ